MISGAEEAEGGVCPCGCGSVSDRNLDRGSAVSLPHGTSLGLGLHPGVRLLLLNSHHTLHSVTQVQLK